MLIISGYMYIDPSVLEQFMGELNLLANAVRQRDGNLSYNAAVEDYQTGSLLISERWVDQDALNAHLIKTDTVEFINRWQGKTKGELFKYDACNERGLMDG